MDWTHLLVVWGLVATSASVLLYCWLWMTERTLAKKTEEARRWYDAFVRASNKDVPILASEEEPEAEPERPNYRWPAETKS